MAVPATAAGTPTLSISSGEVKAGETVTLTVSIKDNPGIAASMVYVYFDDEVFSFAGIDMAKEYTDSASLLTNPIDKLKENSSNYDGAAGKDGVAALWFTIAGEDVTEDGEFLTIKLKANKNAANGEHSIGIGYSERNTCNAASEDVSFQTQSGKLTVTGGSSDKKPSDSKTDKEVPEFKDITGHWAEKYIKTSAELGLVEGYEGLYRPNDTMTRAEFVTILWRSVGEPEPKGKASFTDLKQDWYFKSVAWAEENNVVNGMGGGLFDPTGSVTREQLVTILHRLAGTPTSGEVMFTGVYDSQYPDSSQIGDWAKAALYWSIYEGIYCGENSEDIGSTLAPKKPANRAQIAVMMTRYLNEQ